MNWQQAKQLVEQFEAGTYPSSQWTHASHVVMGLWYLYHLPIHEAGGRIKDGVKYYNLSQGGKNTDSEGYHESITEFYIQVLVIFLRGFIRDTDFDSILEAMRDEPFMHSAFPFEYYSKELLMSVQARREWVPPDLKPISRYGSTRRASA